MREKTLSVFVDESGRFQHPDDDSPYYIISLVLHDQSQPIDGLAADLDKAFSALRLTNVCFHAGPLIRQKGPFAFMDWSFRYRIFNCMMAFARKANFKYHCLVLDKRYVNSREQMVAKLSTAMSDFLDSVADRFEAFDKIKIYYDCGQTPVTNLLHATFKAKAGQGIEFAQAVLPEKYKLFCNSFVRLTYSKRSEWPGVRHPSAPLSGMGIRHLAHRDVGGAGPEAVDVAVGHGVECAGPLQFDAEARGGGGMRGAFVRDGPLAVRAELDLAELD